MPPARLRGHMRGAVVEALKYGASLPNTLNKEKAPTGQQGPVCRFGKRLIAATAP